MSLKKTAELAKQASNRLAILTSEQKNKALLAMAQALRAAEAKVLAGNKRDVKTALKKGIPAAMIARLAVDPSKLKKIASAIESVAKLDDPVGRVLWERLRPNGLKIRKVSVPLGTILIIYESRPNVTADCMALCLKSGNSVILKGGSEALNTNVAMFDAIVKGAVSAGVPKDAFQLVKTPGRSAVKELLSMDETIDLVIPRGGEGLIREVARLSRIPVIKHYKGVCHVYVDRSADLRKAENIVINAKTQNPAVCNAMECLLVHEKVAKDFLPRLGAMLAKKNVEVRADVRARALTPGAKKATEKDWGAEFLDLVLAVRVVKGIDEAIDHIRKYGSRHSDAIVTEDKKSAGLFLGAVDSSAVFVNASTRFNDGGEFGMGAEMGISTDKLHARGPMGLEELTSYKYTVEGDGQIRE
jgi:glutamate-5-semialdehyde dehydrogenase